VTVSELMTLLGQCDPTARALVPYYEDGWGDVVVTEGAECWAQERGGHKGPWWVPLVEYHLGDDVPQGAKREGPAVLLRPAGQAGEVPGFMVGPGLPGLPE